MLAPEVVTGGKKDRGSYIIHIIVYIYVCICIYIYILIAICNDVKSLKLIF